MADRKIMFWGSPDSEESSHETRDDAIEALLDELEDWPKEIVVCGYARMIPSLSLHPLEDCLEALDEEYGNPDGTKDDPTPAMEEAEKAFLAVIEREYRPWACEEVCRETVNVLRWVRDHRHEWLDGSPMDEAERPA